MNEQDLKAQLDEAYEEQRAAVERFQKRKKFVDSFYQKLQWSKLAMDIERIELLPSHNTLIVNDHYFLPYTEAETLLNNLGIVDGEGSTEDGD